MGLASPGAATRGTHFPEVAMSRLTMIRQVPRPKPRPAPNAPSKPEV